jgi:hypothetical protein
LWNIEVVVVFHEAKSGFIHYSLREKLTPFAITEIPSSPLEYSLHKKSADHAIHNIVGFSPTLCYTAARLPLLKKPIHRKMYTKV